MLKNVVLAYLAKKSAVRTGELPVGTPVRVYRNLHNGKLSVQTKKDGQWKVHAHVDDLSLEDVTFKVSQAGRERVLRDGVKNVHAFITGKIADHADMEGAVGVTYRPHTMTQFSRIDTKEPLSTASRIKFDSPTAIRAIL
jgi:hypothetical protein